MSASREAPAIEAPDGASPIDPPAHPPVTMGGLLRRLLPLSLSDVVMAVGDPLQTMTLTRLADPQLTLAAVGIVKAVANFMESPIIMMLHASTALTRQRGSRAALWRFMLALGGGLTVMFVLLGLGPFYSLLMGTVFDASPALAGVAQVPFLLLVGWPFAIAWRRFFQGMLIAHGGGRYVGFASFGRLGWTLGALGVGLWLRGNGAVVAGLTMIGGVVVEALLVTRFARATGAAEAPPVDAGDDLPSSMDGVARFYAPLATTMLGVWGGRALLLAIVARAADAPVAMAAWPAALGFVVLVANASRMVQQVIIATLSSCRDTRSSALDALLTRFALCAGLACASLLALLAWTGPGNAALSAMLGGDAPLVAAALPVFRVATMFPVLVAVQNALQGFSIFGGDTAAVNQATWIGVVTVLTLAVVLVASGVGGALAAATALVTGTVVEVAWLWRRLQMARSSHRRS